MSASFSTLATIYLQLIFQNLDACSFVAAALCSHHTFAAASSEFAMRFLSPLSLVISEGCRSGPSSLLHFVDVELRFLESRFTDAVLNHIQLIPRLRSLDLSHDFSNWSVTALMQQLSNLAGLTKLKLGMRLTVPEIVDITTEMPQLHTLHLLRTRQDLPVWHLLCCLPQLTNLAIDLDYNSLSLNRLPDLAACLKLTQLTLFRAVSRTIVCAMELPNLGERLVQLELGQCTLRLSYDDNADDLSEWKHGFAAMTRLRTLTIRACSHTSDFILAAADRAPALETISIMPKADQILSECPMRHEYTLPSLKDIQCALRLRQVSQSERSTPFCIQLQFPKHCRELNTRRLGAPRWEIEMRGWRALEAKTADSRCRFRLLIDTL